MILALRLRMSPALVSFILMLLPVSGCGGNNTISTSDGGTVLASGVVVLPSDGTVQISQVTASGMTLSGKVPAIAPGNIVLSTMGSGLLRNVIATASSTGTAITLQTTQAAIEDAFQNCDCPFNYTLTARDLASFAPARSGATLTTNPQSGATGAFHLHMPSSDVSGKGTISAGLETDFDLNINGTLQIQNHTIQQFTFVSLVTATATPSLNAVATASAGGDITIGTFTGAPILIPPPTPAEPIPLLVIVPIYELHATANGTISASLSWSPRITETFSAGFSYSPTTGWEPITTASIVGSNFAPTGIFNANLNVTPLNPRASFEFYGVAGPTISANLPTFNFTGTMNAQPAKWSETVSATFSLEGGVSSPVFRTLNKTFPLISTQPYTLYHGGTSTYIYTGMTFDHAGNANVGSRITASLVMNEALPPDFSYTGSGLIQNVVSATISNGVVTEPATVGALYTDSKGIIFYWFIYSQAQYQGGTLSTISVKPGSVCFPWIAGVAQNGIEAYDFSDDSLYIGNEFYNYCGAATTSPGTWSGPTI